MLNFSTKPDLIFFEIVLAGLELNFDQLRADHLSDDDAMRVYYEHTKKIFTRKELFSQVEKLLNAHKSKKLFRLTDYHFLILHDIISQIVSIHNDKIDMEEKEIFSHLQIKNIDMDILTSLYFWDTDFLIPKDHFDMIPLDAKERLGFSQETFGVVHSLKPHPSELELEIMEIPANWSWREEKFFKPGEDYPFIEEDI